MSSIVDVIAPLRPCISGLILGDHSAGPARILAPGGATGPAPGGAATARVVPAGPPSVDGVAVRGRRAHRVGDRSGVTVVRGAVGIAGRVAAEERVDHER